MEDELVIRESYCMYAAQMLRKDYMKDSKDPYYDRPAGCYYRAMSDDFHFNTILDPSATNTLPYSMRGVCVRSMYQLYSLLNIIEKSTSYPYLNLSHKYI
mgnify:CR=1 FL=1